MFWYKAWLESRTRFAITAFVLILFCLSIVLFYSPTPGHGILLPQRGQSFSEHIYKWIYAGTAKGVFAMLAIFLGLGGLLREKAHRTAVFTLALPVSRLRIAVTQIAVGLCQLAALSLIPAIIIPVCSLLVRQSYPLTDALHFSALWFGCGSIIFAASYFLSVVLAGEYTAPVVCYIVLMLHSLIALWKPLRPYRLNLFWIMGEFETMYQDTQHNFLMTGPLPWTKLLIIMLIASALLAAATRIIRAQDF